MPDPSEQPGDPLSEAVQAALATRVDQLSLARLEQYWADTQRRRRNWKRCIVTAAAAAVLLAVALLTHEPSDKAPPVVVRVAPPPEQPLVASPVPASTAPRSPTPLEVAAFYSMSPRLATRSIALHTPPTPAAPTIAEQVAALVADGGPGAAKTFARLDPREEAYNALAGHLNDQAVTRLLVGLMAVRSERTRAAELLSSVGPAVVDDLFQRLGGEDPAARRDAALVLAQINGPEVSRRLIETAADNPRQTEAWLALANCRGPTAQEFLAYAMRQPRLLGFVNAAHARWTAAMP